jgi:chromosome segregation ATPase
MSDDDTDLHTVVAAAIAPLAARIDQLFTEQQEHIHLLAQTTARLDELAQHVAGLRGDALLFDHRTEDARRYADGARSIVMQAEHQMQREIALVNERLLDLTADVHRLRAIRESPEQELYRLHSELAVLQRRLAQIEGSGTSQ